MIDPGLLGLLDTIEDSDLEAVLVLGDFLEERGDPRAEAVRTLYARLYDDCLFAPLAFRHRRVVRQSVLPLFPEYEDRDQRAAAAP